MFIFFLGLVNWIFHFSWYSSGSGVLILFDLLDFSAQSTAKIEELLQEDQNVKRWRERIQKQSSLLSKLTRQLSIHDNRAAAAAIYANGEAGNHHSL